MKHYFFVLICLIFGLFSCKKIKTDRPFCETEPIVIPQDTSFLSTPLVIPMQLIEDKINSAIKRDLVNDDDFESSKKSDKKDNLKVKVTRLGDIKVTWKNNVAKYQVPLLVLIERQIVSKKALPLPKSLAMKTEFSLRIVFETAVDIDENWRLVPQTKFHSFEWLSEVRTLAGIINLKGMVERRLKKQMPEILAGMDDTIRTKVNLDKAINRVWRKIQKPMIINRKEEMVWLQLKPIQFEMGTITTEPGNILVQGRLSTTTQTLVGDNPPMVIDTILPPLIKRRKLPNGAYIYMLSEISFADINQIIGRRLAGKTFNISGQNIKISSAEAWGCGADLVLHLTVRGAVKGDIYLQGIPKYEADSQRLVIQNFDFEVKTQDALLASADWLLGSTFKDQMKDELSLELGDKIQKIPEVIMAGIERGKAGKKIDLFIEQWDFKPQQIWVRPNDIAILVIVNARARLELEKL